MQGAPLVSPAGNGCANPSTSPSDVVPLGIVLCGTVLSPRSWVRLDILSPCPTNT